jgi:hypothetical protein
MDITLPPELEKLVSDVQLGVEQANRGELVPLDIEAIKREGRLRKAHGPAGRSDGDCLD